jgi:membrane associated rhomboid family serine protease
MFPLHTTVVLRHLPIVTWLLIGVNGLFFFLEADVSPHHLQQISYLFGVVPARFTHPDWAQQVGFPVHVYWPFVTSLFLHGGLLHLVGNMWTLLIFGRNVEDQMGPVRFLLFYLLCGIAAGIVHTLVNASSTVPAIGASGAIAGVMGAYLVMFPTSRVVVMIPILFYPLFFDFLAVFYLGYWFLLQLFSGALALSKSPQSSGIAFWAHVGGFAAGALIFSLFLRPRSERQACHGDQGCLERAWQHGLL